MSNFQIIARPYVNIRSIGAWDRTTGLTYDQLITQTADHYWPMHELAEGPEYDYDDLILQDTAILDHWPLNEMLEVIYADYDSQMITDGANNHWPLNDED